jgi:ABC-2 type transport system permease protein
MNRQRVSAIIERELRKFVRTPMILFMTLLMPLMQLFVLGNAFGGRATHLTLAVVDEDGGPAARRVREALYALETNGDMVRPISYESEQQAADDVRHGVVQGALVIPAQFSRRVYAADRPHVGLLLDNTDNVLSGTLRSYTSGAVQRAAREKVAPSRVSAVVALDAVELYPYVPYMRYMLPGVISLGLFMSAMIGGAILYLDDKQRGVHEGYLVTPITKAELVVAQILSGTIKATVGGVLLALIGALSAGATSILEPLRLLALVALVVLVSIAFMAMTSCIVARMNSPIMPRAVFGMLNTLLYFPSGAVYPTQGLPGWLRVIARVDPFTYAVHALRVLLLKGASVSVLLPDLLFLAGFAAVMVTGSVVLFRRTL